MVATGALSDFPHAPMHFVLFSHPGSSLMKLAVKKDGHHFFTHINQVVVVDPPKPPPQPQEKETNGKGKDTDHATDICRQSPEFLSIICVCVFVSFSVSQPVEMKRMRQGSLSAVLDNGIHLSYSFFGPTGEYIGVALNTHMVFHPL